MLEANRLAPRSGPTYVGPDLGSSLFATVQNTDRSVSQLKWVELSSSFLIRHCNIMKNARQICVFFRQFSLNYLKILIFLNYIWIIKFALMPALCVSCLVKRAQILQAGSSHMDRCCSTCMMTYTKASSSMVCILLQFIVYSSRGDGGINLIFEKFPLFCRRRGDIFIQITKRKKENWK